MSWTPPEATLSDEQLEFLRSVDSPTIANAVEPFKVRDRTEGFIGGSVRCLFPDLPSMVGYALTVKMNNQAGPVAGRDGYWRMWQYLEQMPKPAVLVVQDVSGAPTRAALAGEVMSTLAKRLGAVGMVTDGAFRDVQEVHALGFHYFARYVVVSHGNYEVMEVGAPVTLDGATVTTGDIVHGDANGVVIVPATVLPGLPEAVNEVRVKERQTMDFITSEDFTLAQLMRTSGY
ncbi:MAG: RraA family protein [Chloroflexia bacterium]|nr:RraA family protein [Chloroflexia bacterium]